MTHEKLTLVGISLLVFILVLIFIIYILKKDTKKFDKEQQERKNMFNVHNFLDWYKIKYNKDLEINNLQELDVLRYFESLGYKRCSVVDIVQMKILIQKQTIQQLT